MLEAATASRPAATSAVVAPATGPVRVLLVDDEPELLEGLQRVLARRELEVSRASSGEEALAALGREDVDVVVLDLKMPGLSGLDTLREIRRRFPDRVVVVLTGHLSDPEALRCRELGAAEVLAKPPDVPALADALKRAAVDRREARTALERRRLADILERQAD
jgi:DNA-binding NtrC family response regulator